MYQNVIRARFALLGAALLVLPGLAAASPTDLLAGILPQEEPPAPPSGSDSVSSSSCQPPSAPTVTGQAGPTYANQVTLNWQAPANNGGCAITGYNLYWRGCGTTTDQWTLWASGPADARSATGGNWPPNMLCGFTVAAYNGQLGSYGNEVLIVIPDKPGAPSGLTATAGPGAGKVTLQWQASATYTTFAVVRYEVYRSTSSTGTYSLHAYTEGNDLDYEDSNLPAGTTYYYKVIGSNGHKSDPSTVASATTFNKPTAPSGLTATAGPGAGEISLSWSAALSGLPITSYNIYRSTDASSYSSIGTATTTSYTDSGLSAGTTYHYRVSATNDAGEGPQSGSASATTFPVPDVINALTATAGPEKGEIGLSWSAATSDPRVPVQGYKVYRATTSGGGYSHVATRSANQLTYTDGGLPDGTAFFYVVTAYNAAGESAYSPEATAVTFARPGAPPRLTAVPAPNHIVLNWEAAPTDSPTRPVTRYDIYRGDMPGGEYSIRSVPGSQTTYDDTDVEAGKTYYYHVRAWNNIGLGDASSEVSATVPGEETYPIDVTGGGAESNLPSRSTPPTGDIPVGTPDVTTPATCPAGPCNSDTTVYQGGSVYTPPINVPQVTVGPFTVGPFTVPSQHVATLPPVGAPAICDVASFVCLPSQTIPGWTVTTIDGQPSHDVTPELTIGFRISDIEGNVTPNLGDYGQIEPIVVNVPTPFGNFPVTYCETYDPLFCTGPVPPRTDFRATLTVYFAINGAGAYYSAPISGRT